MQPILMRAQRVIVANEPRLFREMLQRAMQDVPGLEVVGEAADFGALERLVEDTGAHWLIVSLDAVGAFPPWVERLLIAHPSLCVLGVADDGSHATIKWVEIHHQTLEGLSLNQLTAMVSARSSLHLTPPYLPLEAIAEYGLNN
ncbi:MAG: hypothetical protein LC737_02865 [Chloroflexi bacterium]|nr:hypothetical protein [Chloroflexota bacterium]